MNIADIIKRKNYMPTLVFISALSTYAFTARLTIRKMLISLTIIVVMYIAEKNYLENCRDNIWHKSNNTFTTIIALLADLILGKLFYDQWMKSGIIGRLADIIHLPKPVIVGTGVIGFAVTSYLFLYIASEMFYLSIGGINCKKSNTINSPSNVAVHITCLLSAIISITICSQSSFIYPLNEWVDAHCFFTVGKSMMNGIVPYRDLFEQKGPLLYFLHGLAWLISKDTFLGVYFLEILASWFFLYYSYKSFCLLTKSNNLAVIPIMAALTYISPAFQKGDSAEELCLGFLAYAIWISLKSFDNSATISIKEYFVVGLFSGCVFWIKFSLVGMYIGWFIVPSLQLIVKRDWIHLRNSVIAIILGVFVSTIPYAVYFGIHGAISDWLKIYIYDNLFSYTGIGNTSFLNGALHNWYLGMKNVNIGLIVLCLIPLFWLKSASSRKIVWHLVFMEVITTFVIFAGGQRHAYYQFILFVFIPFAAAVFYRPFMLGLESLSIKPFRKISAIIICLCLSAVICYTYTPNRYKIGTDKNEMPQYIFDTVIQEKENPTLLNYGSLDGGFYTVSNIFPTCKAFCYLNIALPEIMETQNYYVENGLIDFVVVKNYPLSEDIAVKYEMVYDMFYPEDEVMTRIMLYRLKDN